MLITLTKKGKNWGRMMTNSQILPKFVGFIHILMLTWSNYAIFKQNNTSKGYFQAWLIMI